jgi:hypothetical protein
MHSKSFTGCSAASIDVSGVTGTPGRALRLVVRTGEVEDDQLRSARSARDDTADPWHPSP